MEKGIIYKRRSKWSFPLLGAPKKELEGSKSEIRVCWDGRKLNTLLKDSQYTMPLIGKIFTNCGDKNYFSVIDLAEAFHQLPVHAELQPVLSFTWKGTQYCYARCPFGIKTIPAFIQRLMDSILAPFNNFCGCFIDDIVIYSKSIQACQSCQIDSGDIDTVQFPYKNRKMQIWLFSSRITRTHCWMWYCQTRRFETE